MRENRPYGSEGGESSLTGLPYPYFAVAAYAAQNRQLAFQLKMIIATFELIRSGATVPIYVW